MGNQLVGKQVANGIATLTFTGKPYDLAIQVHDFFMSRHYKLKSGSPENGVYEYGNYVMRILFGAFVTYFKFQTFVGQQGEQTVVRVQKAHSGLSGGVIGMTKLNPDYAIENLLRAKIPANTGISSIFLLTVGIATLSKKNLAGTPVFIGLLTLITISIA